MLKTVTGPSCAPVRGAAQHFCASTRPAHLSPVDHPVGVAIGLNPKLARVVQPVAQVLASIRLPLLSILIGLVKIGAASHWLHRLMLLERNGTSSSTSSPEPCPFPPTERGFRCLPLHRWQRWTKLISPASSLTSSPHGHGLRRTWNASVFAEYSHVADRTLQTIGLGAQSTPPPTAAASDPSARHHPDLAHGRHHEPPGMAPLYRLAETRYKLEG